MAFTRTAKRNATHRTPTRKLNHTSIPINTTTALTLNTTSVARRARIALVMRSRCPRLVPLGVMVFALSVSRARSLLSGSKLRLRRSLLTDSSLRSPWSHLTTYSRRGELPPRVAHRCSFDFSLKPGLGALRRYSLEMISPLCVLSIGKNVGKPVHSTTIPLHPDAN